MPVTGTDKFPKFEVIETLVTFAKNSMFSFHANEPQVFLPQPTSTVPEPVSLPVAKVIARLLNIVPAPSKILTEPNDVVEETPVGNTLCSGSPVAVPADAVTDTPVG